MKWALVVHAVLAGGIPFDSHTPVATFEACKASRQALIERLGGLDIPYVAYCKPIVTYENT